MVRVRKSDVLKELPSKVRKTIPLPLDDSRAYQYAEQRFVEWLHQTFDSEKAARSARMEQLTKLGHLLRLAGKLKTKAVVDWLQILLEGQEKAVVFGVHHETLDRIEEQLAKKGIRGVQLTGRTPVAKRSAIVQRFRSDPTCRVLLGNIQAAGTGLDGLQVTNNVVFVELPWRPADLLQAEDRCHRLGQEKVTWVYYLVATDTVEERLCRVLQSKHKVISKVLDKGTDQDSLAVLTEVLKPWSRP